MQTVTEKQMTAEQDKQKRKRDRNALYYEKNDEHADYHALLLEDLGVDRQSFKIKTLYPNSKGIDCVNIFEHEFNKPNGFYVEIVDWKDFEPFDSKRTIYRVPDNPTFKDDYENGDKGYRVPLSELKAVNPVAAVISGASSVKPDIKTTPSYMKSEPFSLTENEDIAYTEMTIRDFYAIYHNKPVSKRNWLNKLIQNTTKQ